jgi:hypothetical protein
MMTLGSGWNQSWSGVSLKADLFRQASAFCRSQGKEIMPVSSTSTDTTMAVWGSSEVDFRCLSPGDPDLRRPRPNRVRSSYPVTLVEIDSGDAP